MLSFSIEGLTSFSIAPIKFIFSLGLFSLLVVALINGYSIFRKLSGLVVSGWTSLMLSVWFLGGLLLISVSILGVYIGKVFFRSEKSTEIHH